MKRRWTTWAVVEKATLEIVYDRPTREQARRQLAALRRIGTWKPNELRVVKLTVEGEW